MQVKRRIFAGAVCEQMVYTVSDRVQDVAHAEPRVRFKDDAERARHREGISRRRFVRLVNAACNEQWLYSTLTMDNEHEVHTFAEALRVRDLFVRRLQYAAPDVQLIIVMGRGKSTGRIHMHMLSYGVDAGTIATKWVAGMVTRCVHLRKSCTYDGVDCGRDYTGLANYLFDHWTPEQGGRRWKQTRNLRQPTVEPAQIALRRYTMDRAPRAPKGYELVQSRATEFGLLHYKYVRRL